MNVDILQITPTYEGEEFYTFNVEGVSRACLQEIVRHCFEGYFTVESSRYVLKKKLKDEGPFIHYEGREDPKHSHVSYDMDRASKYVVFTGDEMVDRSIVEALEKLRELVKNNKANDIIKYAMPESFKTTLVWTISRRSFQNFYRLRSDKAALWEMQELADKMLKVLPKELQKLVKGD